MMSNTLLKVGLIGATGYFAYRMIFPTTLPPSQMRKVANEGSPDIPANTRTQIK